MVKAHSLAWILLAACGAPMQPGGGDDVAPPPGDDPFVQLATVTCSLPSFDTASIDIEADVTLATGMAVDITVSLPVPPGTEVTQFFSCGSWEPISNSGDIDGCHRTNDTQLTTDRITINHMETFSDGIPPGSNVGVVINVRPAPFSPSSLASDSQNTTCN
jgi:hypothetical protein